VSQLGYAGQVFLCIYNSVLHFNKVIPLQFYIQSNIRQYVVSALKFLYTNGRIFFKFTQMFNSTRSCAEPMLHLCRLKVKVTLEGQNWHRDIDMGYESHSAIVLVLYKVMYFYLCSNRIQVYPININLMYYLGIIIASCPP